MQIEIDGNDGVGKTYWINKLKQVFPYDRFLDRGLLSKATLNDEWNKENKNFKGMLDLNPKVCYIVLDTYIEQCQERILSRGDSIEEEYHTLEDLAKYQKRFQILATSNGVRNIPIIPTYLDEKVTELRLVNYIRGFKDGINCMKLIVGTTNKGKVAEIASILSPLGIDIVPQSLYVEENGKTIEENAVIKAIAYSKENPNTFVLCEDSGLIVPSLKGLPGAYSARFHSVTLDDELNVVSVPKEEFSTDKKEHDKKNNERLVELIKSVDPYERAAYFEVVFCLAKDGEIIQLIKGTSHGHIIDEERGKNGFGYDTVFVGNDTFGKTYAELDSSRKNLRSHRKTALNEMAFFISRKILKD